MLREGDKPNQTQMTFSLSFADSRLLLGKPSIGEAQIFAENHRFSQEPAKNRRLVFGEIQKGTAGRGREKKCHDNLRQMSRQFTTFYDTETPSQESAQMRD